MGRLRINGGKNEKQPLETIRQVVKPYPEEWKGRLEWFASLPLFLDLGHLRAVHAAWDPEAATVFKAIDSVHGEHLRLMAQEGTQLRRMRENLINGVEVALPHGCVNPDKEGVKRDSIRTRWWEPLAGKTYRQVVIPASDTVPKVHIPATAIISDLTYTKDQPPVFFGHYWMPADTVRAPLAEKYVTVRNQLAPRD